MKKSNFTKKDLTNIISQETGFSFNISKKFIDDLIKVLCRGIKDGNLNLMNIGTFRLINKKERYGRNPRTMEKFKIKARKSISFVASKKLIKNLNILY